MTNATNWSGLFYRVSDRRGFIVDALTSDQSTAIPDPDDPGREAAIIYDREIWNPATHRMETVNVFWDDFETFTFRNNKTLVAESYEHGYGLLPFVAAHRRERRCGVYYEQTDGDDLVAAQKAIFLLTTLVLRLHKAQGHKQLVISGDIANVPKDQTIDEENAIVLPDGTSIQSVDLAANASHYTATIDLITEKVAANHGINRDRLNQKTSSPVDEAGLLERRADAIRVFERVEFAGFEVMKVVSKQHEDSALRLSDAAELESVDFGEFEYRTDPKAKLDLWQQMRSMGLRSIYDDIRALNPEIQSDEECEKKLLDNAGINAVWVERLRALNMAKDPQTDEPGQNAEENGAMGAAVRDGKMTKDEAAEQAETG